MSESWMAGYPSLDLNQKESFLSRFGLYRNDRVSTLLGGNAHVTGRARVQQQTQALATTDTDILFGQLGQGSLADMALPDTGSMAGIDQLSTTIPSLGTFNPMSLDLSTPHAKRQKTGTTRADGPPSAGVGGISFAASLTAAMGQPLTGGLSGGAAGAQPNAGGTKPSPAQPPLKVANPPPAPENAAEAQKRNAERRDLYKRLADLPANQLAECIADFMTNAGTDITNRLIESLPTRPDVGYYLTGLTSLRNSIAEDVSDRAKDDAAYQSVKKELEAFRKELVDTGKHFTDNKQFAQLLEYSIEAWRIAISLDDFDNRSHNATKENSLKQLGLFIERAVKAKMKPPMARSQLTDALTRIQKIFNNSGRLAKRYLTGARQELMKRLDITNIADLEALNTS
eukprot:Clim_evm24s15 gene=Clim_evmTU24s15